MQSANEYIVKLQDALEETLTKYEDYYGNNIECKYCGNVTSVWSEEPLVHSLDCKVTEFKNLILEEYEKVL